VEAGGGKTQDGENPPQAEHGSATLDRPQQPRLVGRRDAQAREVRRERAQQGEENAKDGGQALVPLFDSRNPWGTCRGTSGTDAKNFVRVLLASRPSRATTH
jgi:hypothetical protein